MRRISTRCIVLALAIAAVAGGGPLAINASAADDPLVGDFNRDGFEDLVTGVPEEDVGSQQDAGAVVILFGGRNGFGDNGSQVLTQTTAGSGETPEAGDRFGAAVAVGEINGNAGSDLVIGAPGEDLPGAADAGVVHVLVGTLNGLVPRQDLDQGTATLDREAEPGDEWGAALAVAQFDDDRPGGSAQSIEGEIAVGGPGEDGDAGEVDVLHFDSGSQFVVASATQTLIPGFGGVVGTSAPGDRFGAALGHGNFNGDDFDDLAVGAPQPPAGLLAGGAGNVTVFYGTAGPLGVTPGSASIGQLVRQGAPLGGVPEAGDELGATLSAGDFNADGFEELVIAAPGEDGGRGLVHVLKGRAGPLTSTGQQQFSQATAGVSGSPEFADEFGRALAAGDFNNDARADLTIGVPGDGLGGAVNVLYGEDAGGLGVDHQELLTENTIDAGTDNDSADRFGAALASGDFDDDNKEDVVIGVPNQLVVVGQTPQFGAGEIDLVEGSNPLFGFGGLNENRAQAVTQATSGIGGAAEAGDRFGAVLGDLPQ